MRTHRFITRSIVALLLVLGNPVASAGQANPARRPSAAPSQGGLAPNRMIGRWEPPPGKPGEVSAGAMEFFANLTMTADGKTFIPYQVHSDYVSMMVPSGIRGVPDVRVSCKPTGAETVDCTLPILGVVPYRRVTNGLTKPNSEPATLTTWFDREAVAQIIQSRRTFNTTRKAVDDAYKEAMGPYYGPAPTASAEERSRYISESMRRHYAAEMTQRNALASAEQRLRDATLTIVSRFFERELAAGHISPEDHRRLTASAMRGRYFSPLDQAEGAHGFVSLLGRSPIAVTEIQAQLTILWRALADPKFDATTIVYTPTSEEHYAALK